MRHALILAAAALLAGATDAAAQVAKLYPVDEAARDAELFVLRGRLLEAVQRRDTAFVYDIVAADILNSFGGDGGPAEFRQTWRPGDPDSELWAVLTRVLALGGAFLDDTTFLAPYTAARFPDDADPFFHVAVIGSAVRVRERPALDAAVIATLDFDVVRINHDAPHACADAADCWTGIILTDGRRGYISARFTSSAIGYRAGFVRRGGRWLLRWLVAGD